MITLILPGKVPSKKNRIFMAHGRIFHDSVIDGYYNSVAYLIKQQLREQNHKLIEVPVEVSFFLRTDRRSDIDNQLGTLFDLLQKCEVIKNDKLIEKGTFEMEFRKPFETVITIKEKNDNNN